MDNGRISAGGLSGYVYLQIVQGKELRSKNAPYAVIQLGKHEVKTEQKTINIVNPDFNFSVNLKVEEPDLAIFITVYDKGTLMSDFIRKVAIDLALLQHQDVFDDWVELTDPKVLTLAKRIRYGSMHIIARYSSKLAQRTIEISNFDQSVTEDQLYDILAPHTKSKLRIERSCIYTNSFNRKFALVELDSPDIAMGLWDRSLGNWPNSVIIRRPLYDMNENRKTYRKSKGNEIQFF